MIQLVCIALVCAILIVYLKSVNSEFYTLAIVGSSIIILGYAFSYVSVCFELLNKLVELTGISKEFYKILIKITSIGYLVQFGAGTIEDMGLKGLSDKLVMAGKIIIFSLSLPIIYGLINLLTELVQ